jgi:hypothetical protein
MVTVILPHEYSRVNARVGCIDVNALQRTEKFSNVFGGHLISMNSPGGIQGLYANLSV